MVEIRTRPLMSLKLRVSAMQAIGPAPGGDRRVGVVAGGTLGTLLGAVAAVYPGWLDTAGTALSADGPLLALTGEIAEQGGRLLYLVGADDHVVTADQTRLTGEALFGAGVPHELVVYPDTPHGFLADERDTFRPEQADDAWRRIAVFLAEDRPAAG